MEVAVRDELSDRLGSLHDEYTALVNAAIHEDRFDLVDELARRYTDEALELISAA